MAAEAVINAATQQIDRALQNFSTVGMLESLVEFGREKRNPNKIADRKPSVPSKVGTNGDRSAPTEMQQQVLQ